MGIIELFEIGFFTTLWDWSNFPLTMTVYSCIALGCIIQGILQKKCDNSNLRWLFIGLCAIGIIVCECIWHMITGWDRLGLDFIYGFIICLLLGSIIVIIISKYMYKKGKLL